MKNTTKRFTTLAATALIAVSTLGAAAVTASAKSVDVQPSTTQYGVVQQVKNARAFKYNAYGKTSYGYDYTYKATNNNLIVKVNYNFKAHKYEFNVIVKKAKVIATISASFPALVRFRLLAIYSQAEYRPLGQF